MKASFRLASQVSAFVFGLAAATELVGLVSFQGLTATVLIGGFAISSLMAVMLGDYGRKPSFRVRRTAGDSIDAGPTINRPADQSPDWTYATPSK